MLAHPVEPAGRTDATINAISHRAAALPRRSSCFRSESSAHSLPRLGGEPSQRAQTPIAGSSAHRAHRRAGTHSSAPHLRPRPAAAAPAAEPAASRRIIAAPRRSLAEAVEAYAAGDAGDAEQECLARAVYFEAKGEPLRGQLAVAQVILNRTQSGRFPSSVCGVVKQRGQFSFVRGGHFPPSAARLAPTGASRRRRPHRLRTSERPPPTPSSSTPAASRRMAAPRRAIGNYFFHASAVVAGLATRDPGRRRSATTSSTAESASPVPVLF